ncbi:MAG: hypothetical protein LRY51_15070 [Geovibrio sp.]|nr:hypothetical protein [Geovibrio sp.]
MDSKKENRTSHDINVAEMVESLERLGVKLKVSHQARALHTTYLLTRAGERVFVGNYENFLKFITSFSIIWEAIVLLNKKELVTKENEVGGAA